jgi:cytochrome c-type biogenesis protein
VATVSGTMTAELTIALGVFVAGLVSFLSPCVLPLVPPYLAYLGGTSLERISTAGALQGAAYRRTVLAAACFVAGFTTVFVTLGATASLLGQLVLDHKDTLARIAGVIIILFGLHFLGVLKIPLLYVERRFHTDMSAASLGGAYVIGLAFAFGWTPCVGPVLATVLTVAAQDNSVHKGIYLLLIYSLGLGVPFLLAAVAIRPFLSFMQRFKRHLGLVEKAMGAALVATGILFLTGALNAFGLWMLETFPVLGTIEEWFAPKDLQKQILDKARTP